MEIKSASLFERLTIILAYFFAGLGSSFLFWWGLLFGFPFPEKIGLISFSLTIVFVAWISHRKRRGDCLMIHTTWAFVGGGIISAVGVWLLYLLLLWFLFIIETEY